MGVVALLDVRWHTDEAATDAQSALAHHALRSVEDLEGYAVGATDGTIGYVEDFYFDDRAWVVRYLVVEAGAWLVGRKVPVSPVASGRPDRAERLLHVLMTKSRCGTAPISTPTSASRGSTKWKYSGCYGYPYCWGGAGCHAWAEEERSRTEDPHLRSCLAVMKHHVHASDGDIGHVDGMLVDDATWAVRYPSSTPATGGKVIRCWSLLSGSRT